MIQLRRAATSIVLSAVVVGLLTSCSPPTFVWGFVSDDGDVRFGFCGFQTITMMRVSVYERPIKTLLEVNSAVWSGPRIEVPEGAIMASDSLPDQWRATNDLDLGSDWETIEVALYDGAEFSGSEWLYRDDVEVGRWSLNPGPSLIFGAPDCEPPQPAVFRRQPPIDLGLLSVNLAEAHRLAMPEEAFWQTIALAGSEDNWSLTQLRGAMATATVDEASAFRAQLMLQYYTLDTALVWQESERQRSLDDSYYSDTGISFTKLRSAIILGGEASVDAALNGEVFPELSASAIWLQLPEVAGSVTQETVDLSVGMGQNSDGW